MNAKKNWSIVYEVVLDHDLFREMVNPLMPQIKELTPHKSQNETQYGFLYQLE